MFLVEMSNIAFSKFFFFFEKCCLNFLRIFDFSSITIFMLEVIGAPMRGQVARALYTHVQ